MKEVPRVVIDNNVFISALLKSKNCSAILEAFLDGKFDLVISEELISELIDVVSQPKFSSIILTKDINELLELLSKEVEIILPKSKFFTCRDTKDNMVLECAFSGDVECIVTGDNDLLELKKFKGIPILTPQKFLKYIK
ncbi:MAG: putative toxin-antitoxin system toxin component, PIN family [Bacteroidota bacterium]